MDPWVHIIGGGLSGLSLASSLARFDDLPGRVVISEPNPEALASKTFSFWFSGKGYVGGPSLSLWTFHVSILDHSDFHYFVFIFG